MPPPVVTPKHLRDVTQMLTSAASSAKRVPVQQVLEPQHKEYLDRLSTFTVARWFAKPAALSPLECARHGWRCSAADRLQCPLCAARLVCVIRPDLDAAGTAAVTVELRAALASKHEATCYFRDTPLPVDILRGPDASGGRELLHERLSGLAKAAEGVGVPTLQSPCSALASAAKEHQSAVPEVKHGLVEMFAIALAGWRATSSSPHGIFVQCECCHAKGFLGRGDTLVWDIDGDGAGSAAGAASAASAASGAASASASAAAAGDGGGSDGAAAAADATTASESSPRVNKTPPRKFPPRSELAAAPTSGKQLAAARIGTGRRFGVLPPTAVARQAASATLSLSSSSSSSSGDKRPRTATATPTAALEAARLIKRARTGDSRDFSPRGAHRGFCPFYRASLRALTLPVASSTPQRLTKQHSNLKLKDAIGLLKSAVSPSSPPSSARKT